MNKKVELLENERLDDIDLNNYKIIQNKEKFCFGIDAVLLSHFAKAKYNERVLDIGTGNGIIPIIMSCISKSSDFTAFEIQEDISSMAKRSVAYNNLDNKINIINSDIKNYDDYFKYGYFDVVTTNPPYMIKNSGETNLSKGKAIARHEITCTIDDIIENSAKALKYGGRFYMVHRPNRLTDIIVSMRKYSIEPKTIRFVSPYIDKKPNIVLIEGLKNGKSFLNVLENLVIYNKDGSYTKEVNDFYYKET